MFTALMAVFAVAISAAALGVAWLTISGSAAGVKKLESWARHANSELMKLKDRVDGTTNSKLKAELDDLRGALDVMRASNRKEFGSLWGKIGRGANNGRVFDGATGAPLTGDDELEAVIALQTAKPVSPNGSV